jgi:hypothetical protein
MADWEIKKTLGQCCLSGEVFQPQQEYFAALIETEEGFERQDYSFEAWHSAKPQVYCFWRTRMPDADEKKRLFVDDEVLMTFFDRLACETDTEKINFRFVLALILMRKRLLKYDSSVMADGVETWRLRVTGTERYEEVVNPDLTEDEIEQVSLQMGEILQMDF